MSQYSKYERELVERLSEKGYMAFRHPASGGGTADDRGDVMAGKPAWGRFSKVLIFEVKYVGKNGTYATLDRDADLEQPRSFAERFGGRSFVALRWYRDTTWYIRRTEIIDVADGCQTRSIRRDRMNEWKTVERDL